MFNDINIKIFDYIYSNNAEDESSISDTKKLDEQFKNNNINKYDFWSEYKYIIGDNQIIDSSTLSGNNYTYRKFPTIKFSYLNEYLEYKCNQFAKILENNISYDLSDISKLKKDLNINSNTALKNILDKCIENKLIKKKNEYWMVIPGTKKGRIDGNQLSVNEDYYKKEENTPFKIVNNIVNGDNYGTINQGENININDNELYNLVLEKLEALKVEENLTEETVNEIKIMCENKEKNKLVNFLKEIAMGTGTNLIASGILKIFGIM